VSGNESPPSQINWEAYRHEELHRMLWQDADVADVSTVADEWTRHRAALDTHAEVLREQRSALLDGWTGEAADEAGARLAALAERIEKISALCAAGQRAAQDSADALAAARAAMPPPPDGPTMPAFAGLPAPFALPTVPTTPFTLPSAPAPMSLPSAPTVPAGTSGFYFYFGAAAADQQKQQAVRTMQTYESSLNGSGRLIDDARANVPQAAPPPRPAPPAVKTPSSGGVPWQRLVSGATTARVPVIGAATPASQQPSPGLRTGVIGQHAGVTATGPFAADTRAAAQNNAMASPPAGAARKDDERTHENQMPTLDHDLFAVNERVSPAVIGEES
jgi:hypothetical protein